MIDFSPVRQKIKTITDLAAGMDRHDLIGLTNGMIDLQQRMLEGIRDDDVMFLAQDPEAHDKYAAVEDDVALSWTLGHVIVHTTASSEESTAQGLSLARGLAADGRMRQEKPWQRADSVIFVTRRLEESRRMRIAMLEAWPDEPDLRETYTIHPSWPAMNAVARVLTGLYHDDSHSDQIRDLVAKAKVAR